MRVYIFRNDDEGLHAYTQDAAGHNLPVSLGGVGWKHCGVIPDLHKLFPIGQATRSRTSYSHEASTFSNCDAVYWRAMSAIHWLAVLLVAPRALPTWVVNS